MKKDARPSPQKPGAIETPMPAVVDEASLLSDLRGLIQSARQRIAGVAYSIQTLLCWHVGRRLSKEHLHGGRAAYGKQILVTVSRELTADYGRGFSYAEIARMIQFSQVPLLRARLHQAIEHARENAARRLPAAEGQP